MLTGRHGFFSSYEAFVHIIDSMFNQHAKWLEKSKLEAAVAGIPMLFNQSTHYVPRLAAGSQRIYPSGPRLSGCGDEQESGGDEDLSSAGRELSAERREITAFGASRLHQRDRGG